MGKSSFGLGFVLINDVRQRLHPSIFSGGPWEHLATVIRGTKEYVAIRHLRTGKVYLEEIDQLGNFSKIKEDAEWADLFRFLKESGTFNPASTTKVLNGES